VGVVGVVVGVVGVVGVWVCVGVVGVVGVVWVVVVLAVEVVVVGCASGCLQSSRACLRRFTIPWCNVLRSPVSMLDGSAPKSCSVFRMAASVSEQSPLPDCAAWATASKSLCSGPALAAGISFPVEAPQETSSAAARPAAWLAILHAH
jgi:hypothetical protein